MEGERDIGRDRNMEGGREREKEVIYMERGR